MSTNKGKKNKKKTSHMSMAELETNSTSEFGVSEVEMSKIVCGVRIKSAADSTGGLCDMKIPSLVLHQCSSTRAKKIK